MEDRKEILRKLCKDILNMDSRTIDLMRKTPLFNIRAISRGSKSIKNPDPLSTTMATMSLKFPISVNKNAVRSFGIPSEMTSQIYDSRIHNRILCKKEIVDWYLENGPLPSEEEKDSIHKIMLLTKEKRLYVNSIDWSEIGFTVGDVDFDRARVATNPRSINIPNRIKDQAIAQILSDQLLMTYEPVPEKYLRVVKEIVDTKLLKYTSIEETIRYIRSSLDPRMRYLPIIEGLDPNFIHIRHLAIQNNLKISSFKAFVAREESLFQILHNICGIILLSVKENLALMDLSKIMYNGTELYQLLQEEPRESAYIKGVRAIMGIPCHSNFVFEGFQVDYSLTSGHPSYLTTKSGLKVNIYEELEIVYIHRDDCKMQLRKKGRSIVSLTSNFQSILQFDEMLAIVAIIIRQDAHLSTAKTIMGVYKWIFEKFHKKPWEVLEINHGLYKLMKKQIKEKLDTGDLGQRQMTNVLFTERIDVEPGRKDLLVLNIRTMNLYNKVGENCGIINLKKLRTKTLPEGIERCPLPLSTYLCPIEILTYYYHYYNSNMDTIINYIIKRNFSPKTTKILDFVPAHLRIGVSKAAEKICVNLCMDPNMQVAIPFFWCFIGLKGDKKEVSKFTYAKKHLIDFSLSEGNVFLNRDDGTLKCFGRVINRVKQMYSLSAIFTSPIEGFRITLAYNPNSELKPISWIIKNKDEIKNGTEYLIYKDGIKIGVKKDINFKIDSLKTLIFHTDTANQSLGEQIKVNTGQIIQERTKRKRKASNSEETDVKRQKRLTEVYFGSTS